MPTVTIEEVVCEISRRIENQESIAVLRADFDDLEESGLVEEALNSMVASVKLVQLGDGVFATARINSLTGKPTTVEGFKAVALEALDRLGIEWKYSLGEQEYLDGKSNLIPGAACVVVEGPHRPALSFEGLRLKYWDEKARNWVKAEDHSETEP